jgi:glutaredoxin 3
MAAGEATVVLYTTPFCGYCAAAKRLLEEKGVDYIDIDVMMDPAKRAEMNDRSGRRTVPQIFIGDTHVGGFDDLNALEQKGELDALLEGVFGPADNQGD